MTYSNYSGVWKKSNLINNIFNKKPKEFFNRRVVNNMVIDVNSDTGEFFARSAFSKRREAVIEMRLESVDESGREVYAAYQCKSG